ncbi:MAG: hypothetical protein K0S53_995 [Bacteroidetes bacterium]|jgi:hypothetical protein|nr:hypothetical protein [Bacteroidota bacterium]MDF2453104.1 hypothetical protein [Bacteroidota bacterium]
MSFILRLAKYSFLVLVLFVSSCRNNGLKIEDFDPLANYQENTKDTLYRINTDLSDAVLNGIEIPTKKQTKNGYFTFTFKVENTSSEIKKYYYKIFYQNQDYKFVDTLRLAEENFYGSWAEGLYTFKPTKFLFPGEEIIIRDSFKIVGNPRNEKKYFGADPEKYLNIDELIIRKMEYIKTVPEWLSQITQKAKRFGGTVNEQIYLDALWAINYEKEHEVAVNNRWKRNPRMGNYEFMLVVTSPEDIGKIPMEIRDLQLVNKDEHYNNPFGYFLFKEGKDLKNTTVLVSEKKLKISSTMDLGAGIYIDKLSVNKSNFTTDAFGSNCNTSAELYHKANFQQYFHNIDKDFTVYNIPEIKDVTGENLTRKEYNDFKTKYDTKEKRIQMYVSSTDCPCKTVISNPVKKSITMINPSVTPDNYRKEHVGISSRLGFTYGKIRAKVKFPKMLSKDNVWNGITNAFWLLYQSENEWNNRRDCNAEIGYIPKSEPDNYEALKHSKKTIPYSEIDFEIVKESQHWPKTSYKNSNIPYKTEDAAISDNIMVTCTNWDMACHEPKKFSIGAKEFKIDSTTAVLHRWDHFYKALSTKRPVKHDEIFGAPYYYFEIEWLPEKIIWKIGPEKDKMRVIAVMDKNVTSVPNNQMMIIFTQEWHNEEWWPTAPFKQNHIPFPKKELVGEILEITIE